MKNILLIIAVSIIAFSSCYEDSKPLVRIHIDDIEPVESRTITISDTSIETLYIAIYRPTNMNIPVSIASVSKGATSIIMYVPIGQIIAVAWTADADNNPISCGSSVVYDIGGNSTVNVDIGLGNFGESYWTNIFYDYMTDTISWSAVPGATEYEIQYSTDGGTSYSPVTSTLALSYSVSDYVMATYFRVRVKQSVFGLFSEWRSTQKY